MAKIELRIAAPIWDALCAYHLDPAKRVEALSYVFAEMEYVGRNYFRILVPHTAPLFRFAADCFESQSGGHVRLRDDVQRGLLIAFARSHLSCLINIHDHWFDAHPVFSSIDDADDLSFDRYLRQRFEPALPQIEGAVARRSGTSPWCLGAKVRRHASSIRGPVFRSCRSRTSRWSATATARSRPAKRNRSFTPPLMGSTAGMGISSA